MRPHSTMPSVLVEGLRALDRRWITYDGRLVDPCRSRRRAGRLPGLRHPFSDLIVVVLALSAVGLTAIAVVRE